VNKLRAIVFDDEPVVRELLSRVLRRRGYEVFSYADPSGFCPFRERCACVAGTRCADLILTDYSMPHLNGIDFLLRQKQRGCRTRYLGMISAFWTREGVRQAEDMGCRIFYKPVTIAELNQWFDECEATMDWTRRLMPYFSGSGMALQEAAS
jgi:CheY-like chemotaxis protein